MRQHVKSDQKYCFLVPIGLKFWGQAFLNLGIQKIHSAWPEFFEKKYGFSLHTPPPDHPPQADKPIIGLEKNVFWE